MKRKTDAPDLEQLKRTVSLLSLLPDYGISPAKKGKGYVINCPFHDEKTPSLSISPENNLWHCFGCGKGGSVIDFVMEIDHLDFREAVEKLQLKSGGSSTVPNDSKKSVSRLSKPKTNSRMAEHHRLTQSVVGHYHKTLFDHSSAQGLDYLRSRSLGGLDPLKTFHVGYVDGSLKKKLSSTSIKPLKDMGLLNEKGNEFFYGCVVVPVFDESGRLCEMYGRSVTGSRHLYLSGPHCGVINRKAAEVYDEIILTEAPLDALALYGLGIKHVIPCYGTNGFTDDHRELLKDTRRVYLAFDNDKAGDEGAQKLAQSLDADGVLCHRIHLPAEAGKDVNDYVRHLKKQGMPPVEIHAAFLDLQKRSRRIGFTVGRSRLALLNPEETNDEEAAFVFGSRDLVYRVRGLFENNTTSLRLIITAGNRSESHTDRFDLYIAKNRISFAHRSAARLEMPAARIEEDLSDMIPMLENIRAERGKQADRKNEPPPIGESEKKDALRLLKSQNLLKRIAADLGTVGYVGEEQNKQLAYLIATSRKLLKPLSGIIRSESGAGKSYLMECAAELMPPEDVQYFSRLTPQSLYYMGENELVHKLLIVDERDGSEESEYPIRTLQTRRKLTLAVPMKDAASGKIRTRMLSINGPIAYMESSTQQSINPENLNRCFELYLDSTKQQTMRIMKQQRKARTLDGLKEDTRRGTVVHRHHNAQRLLQPLKVVIPFADHIRFPSEWIRTRRDHERFLSLLEIVAFVHQHQREIKTAEDEIRYLEASIEDYRITYELAQTVFVHSLHDLTKPAKELLEQIKKMVSAATRDLELAIKNYWFTRRNIREYTKLPDHQIKRTIRQLEDLEYLEVRRATSGGSHRYRLPDQKGVETFFAGLTTPGELEKSFSEARKS